MIEQFLRDELSLFGKASPTGWYRCRCPYHSDSNPSFAVYLHYPHMFKCLGCGEGGSLVKLVAKCKKLNFRQARLFIQSVLEVDMVEVGRLLRPSEASFVPMAAVEAFAEMLPGSEAMGYCRGRGLSGIVLSMFGAGYEPATKRLMIPFWGLPDLSRCVGFDTREALFDWDKSVDIQRGWRNSSVIAPRNLVDSEGVIVTEGFFDAARVTSWLIRVSRLGDYFPVAIGGNQVSQSLAKFLSTYDKICLGFDWDKGGDVAVSKLKKLLPERNFQRLLGDGEDPGDSNDFEIRSLVY